MDKIIYTVNQVQNDNFYVFDIKHQTDCVSHNDFFWRCTYLDSFDAVVR